jgi:mono/diheme cytochrome c family protein
MKIFFLAYFIFISYLFNIIQKEKSFDQSISDGKMIYEDFCIQCHLNNGEGIERVYPPLNKSDYLLENIDKSIYSIKYGLKGEIIVNGIKYNGVMLNQGLEDDEIADVMNYITNSWDNNLNIQITEKRVNELKK